MKKYEKYAVIAMLLAIILRFSLAAIYTPSGDACWHFSASKFIGDNAKMPLFEPLGRDEPFWAPPLFHIVASVFYAIFSPFNNELGLKLIAPLFGSLTIITSYLIFRRFLNERASFYSIFFMSFTPIFIDYSVLGYAESILTFFIALSIYLALKNMFFLSGIAAGLSILTKYNGAFAIPVLLFIAYKSYSLNKLFLKNAVILTIVPGIISLPWLIRNWLLLGNPIWPFLNFIFRGFEKQSFSGIDIQSLFSAKTYIATYLGIFGIPDGNYQALLLADIPYLYILFPLFLIGTVIFIIPLLFGFKKNKDDKIFYALLLSFLVLFLLYIANVGPFVSRMLLPALIAIAFFYGIGLDRIMKYKRLKAIFLTIMIATAAGFALAETGKFAIASKSWKFYQEDFNWVKSNTNKEDIFIAGGQCIQYHIDRTSLFPSELETGSYDYVWINQGFILDERSILSKEHLEELESKNKELAYENKKTGTKVYKIVT